MRPVGDGRFELDDDEIALAMQIGDRLKTEFAIIGQAAIASGHESGIPDHVILSALCTEALLLAACCHNGTPESFLVMVKTALIAAARNKAEPNDKVSMQ
jgi:hypothetical protein